MTTYRDGLLTRIAVATAVSVGALWVIGEGISSFSGDAIGAVFWVSIGASWIVVMFRLATANARVGEDSLFLRGVFRTRRVGRPEIADIETPEVNSSFLIRFRKRDGRAVYWPIAISTNRERMGEVLESVHRWLDAGQDEAD